MERVGFPRGKTACITFSFSLALSLGVMADYVEEEVSIRNADDLISNGYKQEEPFATDKPQFLDNSNAQFLAACARVNLKRSACVIREYDGL